MPCMKFLTAVVVGLCLASLIGPAAAVDEPAVRETVIDDGRARIEELRVRGQVQRITVDPKGPAPRYEIIVGDGSRDFSQGVNTSRGAAGKRVWNVLRF